ncbi:MAG: proton-conducting transporter membrane subunit [Armatimonadota bacterium]
MSSSILLYLILLPVIAAVAVLLLNKVKYIKEAIALIVTAAVLAAVIMIFNKDMTHCVRWCGFGLEMSLRNYNFSSFIMLFGAGFAFLIALYSLTFMKGKEYLNQFYAYLLITLGFFNGAVLSNNLGSLVFFWEGLLIVIFGFIVIGGKLSFKTAVKAFIISGVADICFILGIGLTYYIAKTLTISDIHMQITTLSSIAFIFLIIGAVAKSGAMPFHSWIPDAALDAPLPFMAFMPASLDKLLGIYFLTRIVMDIYQLNPHTWLSTVLMIVGAVTIILAVMMALVQKDYKRLLSYHAISQAGYMVLGIGTCLPVGIIGGIFHMVNNALYKCGLFLTGGAVEKQTGTTDLKKLGGLAKFMPITCICFLITAFSISGFPGTNGFFSKELVYEAALDRGWIYYAAALVGTFLTAASFLKLGHAAYYGKATAETKKAKEVNWTMSVPMLVIAAVCLLFGLYNALPIRDMIQPILGEAMLHGHNYGGMPTSWFLVGMTVIALGAAVINHIYGVKKSGSGLGASDHIHNAPILSGIYAKAEKRYFDPYDIGLKIVDVIANISWYIDRAIDWIYEKLAVTVTFSLSHLVRRFQTGNYTAYLLWCIAGVIVVVWAFFRMTYNI